MHHRWAESPDLKAQTVCRVWDLHSPVEQIDTQTSIWPLNTPHFPATAKCIVFSELQLNIKLKGCSLIDIRLYSLYVNIDQVLWSLSTHSLGLVLTSTLRGPLLWKHCFRKFSTSWKGLKKTRSPLMAKIFFPTSRPAICTRGTKEYQISSQPRCTVALVGHS